MRLVFILALFVLLSTSVFAQESNLTCQYRVNVTTENESLNVYNKATGQFVTSSLRTQFDGFGLNLYNDYEVPLTVRVMFEYSREIWVGHSEGYRYDGTVTIEPRPNYVTIQEGRIYYEKAVPNKDSLQLTFLGNNYTYTKYEKKNVTTEVCTGKFPDGAVCSNSGECGGDFCVLGRCNNAPTCYQSDCQCGESTIQCGNNSCVSRRVLEVGIKTSCSLGEECVSGLVDNNGVCIKSEVQRLQEAAEAVAIRTATLEANAAAEKKAQEERDKQMRNMLIIVYLVSFVGVLAVVVIAVFGYLYWKKLENEKIKAEMQKAVAQIESKEEKIRELDDRIDSLFQDYRLRKAELETATRDRANRLAGLEMEYERRKKELEEQKKNMDKQVKAIKANWKRTNKPFPYELVGNRKVIINPDMGGYYCFYDERTPLPKYPPSKTCHNRLVHRWIWENHHGRKVRVGYHIHHRDEDKYNNSIENLEEIDGDEHFALHRKKYDNG